MLKISKMTRHISIYIFLLIASIALTITFWKKEHQLTFVYFLILSWIFFISFCLKLDSKMSTRGFFILGGTALLMGSGAFIVVNFTSEQAVFLFGVMKDFITVLSSVIGGTFISNDLINKEKKKDLSN